MLVKCTECGKDVSDQAEACPHCGHATVKAERKKESRTGCLWAIGIFIVLAVIGSISQKQSSNPSTNDASSTLAPEAPEPIIPNAWQYSETPDAINGGTTKQACVESNDEITQDFPYRDVTATLCIRRGKKYGLDSFVYLNGDGQVLCENYEGCSIKVKFDSNPPSIFTGSEASDHSTNIVFLNNASRFLNHVKAAQKTMVQLRIYQHGDQTVTFNTANLKWP